MSRSSERTGKTPRDEGFTLVELLIVTVLSLIMLAGMVGLLSGAFGLFGSSADLQAVTDSARRILPAMTRQIRGALWLVDEGCGEGTITFYADIDNNDPSATKEDYGNTDLVRFSLASGSAWQETWRPQGGGYIRSRLGSCVSGLKFFYFPPGAKPIWSEDQQTYTNRYRGSKYNTSVGHVVIMLTMRKGDVSRVFTQAVFLRVLKRGEE